MKRQAYTVIAMIVLVGAMAVVTNGQAVRHARMNANIPFEFNVGDKILPPGEYIVRQLNPDSDVSILQIRSQENGDTTTVQMITAVSKVQDSTKLVFRRYGNKYFFAEAWVAGDSNGLQAPRSRAERAVQRELAGIKPTAETVALKNR